MHTLSEIALQEAARKRARREELQRQQAERQAQNQRGQQQDMDQRRQHRGLDCALDELIKERKPAPKRPNSSPNAQQGRGSKNTSRGGGGGGRGQQQQRNNFNNQQQHNRRGQRQQQPQVVVQDSAGYRGSYGYGGHQAMHQYSGGHQRVWNVNVPVQREYAHNQFLGFEEPDFGYAPVAEPAQEVVIYYEDPVQHDAYGRPVPQDPAALPMRHDAYGRPVAAYSNGRGSVPVAMGRNGYGRVAKYESDEEEGDRQLQGRRGAVQQRKRVEAPRRGPYPKHEEHTDDEGSQGYGDDDEDDIGRDQRHVRPRGENGASPRQNAPPARKAAAAAAQQPRGQQGSRPATGAGGRRGGARIEFDDPAEHQQNGNAPGRAAPAPAAAGGRGKAVAAATAPAPADEDDEDGLYDIPDAGANVGGAAAGQQQQQHRAGGSQPAGRNRAGPSTAAGGDAGEGDAPGFIPPPTMVRNAAPANTGNLLRTVIHPSLLSGSPQHVEVSNEQLVNVIMGLMKALYDNSLDENGVSGGVTLDPKQMSRVKERLQLGLVFLALPDPMAPQGLKRWSFTTLTPAKAQVMLSDQDENTDHDHRVLDLEQTGAQLRGNNVWHNTYKWVEQQVAELPYLAELALLLPNYIRLAAEDQGYLFAEIRRQAASNVPPQAAAENAVMLWMRENEIKALRAAAAGGGVAGAGPPAAANYQAAADGAAPAQGQGEAQMQAGAGDANQMQVDPRRAAAAARAAQAINAPAAAAEQGADATSQLAAATTAVVAAPAAGAGEPAAGVEPAGEVQQDSEAADHQDHGNQADGVEAEAGGHALANDDNPTVESLLAE